MKIEIDTNNLSEMDIAMLGFLAGQSDLEVDEAEAPEPEPTPEPVKKAKAPAKKAPEPEPTPEPEVPTSEEDTSGGDEDLISGDAPTMSDAVAAATKHVSTGGSAKVKEALAAVGAKRVSEMKTEDIPAFLAALDQ